jgi:hypothetical protein
VVVNQKTKIIELTDEYSVFDGNANRLRAARQIGQSTLRKAARLFTSLDQYLTHKLGGPRQDAVHHGRPRRAASHRQLEEPLRTLVVASALSVDSAMNQDERGFN